MRAVIWYLRQRTVRLLERFGLKERFKAILKPLLDTNQKIEDDAYRFYRRSIPTLPQLPPAHTRILFFTGRAIDLKFPTYEGLIGWALRARGAEPIFLICDGFLSACELGSINHFGSAEALVKADKITVCTTCYKPDMDILTGFGWVPERLSSFVQPEDWRIAREITATLSMQDCFTLVHEGINIGEHIEATAYRVLLSASLKPDDMVNIQVARRLALNAVVQARIMPRVFGALRPECVVAHHGIYLTAGIACDYARQRGIRVVNWTIPYRRNTVLFSHGDTYHRTMGIEPVDQWENHPLSHEDRDRLADYLGSHYKSGWDLVSYNRDTYDDPLRLAAELNLDMNRPIVGLYTNLAWDARIHYKGNTFANHSEWLLETINALLEQTHVQLVIRVHPAEVKSGLGPVRERADMLIKERFPALPSHIHVIPPESPQSSYALMRLTALNVVFGTKMGLEMAANGLKVVVAGEAWYRAKGFTYDSTSREQYFAWLRDPLQLPSLTPEQIERATRYTYHFYFRRNISFPSLVYVPGVYQARSVNDLLPGTCPNIDVICDGIIKGTPFVAETA